MPELEESVNEPNVDYERAIVNEPLCYIVQYIQSCSKDQISKAVQGFYTIDEIIVAKQVLYTVYNEQLCVFPQRNPPQTDQNCLPT